MKKISEIIQQEIQFSKESFDIEEGLEFNHFDTIKRIKLYLNSKYVDKKDDSVVFWNLSTPRIPHFTKNIDIDTKDLQPYGQGETNWYQTWILKMKFYKWQRENGLSIKLNELGDGLSSYGSCVWKKAYDKGEVVIDETNLQNLFFDPSAKTLKDSDFVIEKHFLTASQLRAKSNVWNGVETVIKNGVKVSRKDDDNDDSDRKIYFEVYERYGEIEDNNGNFKYTKSIVSGIGDKEVVLFEDEIEPSELPYFDFHLGKYRGRWLREGVVERLFNLQVRVNTLCNQNAETTAISSLLLLKSQEAGMVGGNVLSQVENGQILNSSDLQQVGIDNRNLASFLNEVQLIENQADKLCMTPEVVTGEQMPSGTTFRGQATLTNAAKSAFKNIRDDIGARLSEILLDHIFPALVKKWNRDELFEMIESPEDIFLYDEMVKFRAFNEKIFYNSRTLRNIDVQAIQKAIEEEVDRMNDRKIKHGKNFFNFDYGIRLNVTGESVDKAQRNDAYNNIIQWVMSNPNIQDNPYFKQYVEENNISTRKMKKAEIQQMQQQPQGGQVPNQKPIGAGNTDKLSAIVDTQ